MAAAFPDLEMSRHLISPDSAPDPLVTTSGTDPNTPPVDDGPGPSPDRRQVPKAPGGINYNMKVLYCTGISCKYNYRKIFNVIRPFGIIERIRLVLDQGEVYFDLYVIFKDAEDAKTACASIVNEDIVDIKGKARLFDIRNFEYNDGDYIPKEQKIEKSKHIVRKMQLPLWHVVTLKEGYNNILMARENLEDQIGEIGEKNLSRYGRNILVKAEHKSQAKLLTTFSPEEDDIVTSVTPHRSFNTARGVVFNRDLYDFDEKEILKRCPEEVLSVKKLKGKNGAIQLTFSSSYLPDYVRIARVTMNVKKFKQRPIQCHKCYEYGHVEGNCPPERPRRCYICSGKHDLISPCKKERFCFHCEGSHSPNWRECPSFLIEKEILEVAANEHISMGAARRRVKPWKGKKTYANATAKKKPETPGNSSGNKTPVVQTEASKTPVDIKVTQETPVSPAGGSGTRPKHPTIPSPKKNEHSKHTIAKHQLPASQLEIHEAPVDILETPVVSPINESPQSAVKEATSDKPLTDQSGNDAISEPLSESQPDVSDMESEISRSKRSRSSSPPISRIPSVSTSNRYDILEEDKESTHSSSNTSNPSKKSEGVTKDAISKKSKILDKASVSKIKKPKIKSLFNKPLLSRSVHLAAGELSKKIRK